MPDYREAPEVAKIAEGLIKKHHSRLEDIRVEFVFRDKAATKGGKAVCGQAKKIGGLNAFMSRAVTSDIAFDPADDFFVVTIAEDEWDRLDSRGRLALVDHELCHLAVEYDQVKEEWKLSLRGHDVEEFAEIVERHGAWNVDLREFAVAVKTQLSLLDADAA